MVIKLVKNACVIEPSDVEKLEEQLGSALPLDYRQFLLEWNGGEPETNVHADDENIAVESFHGIMGPEDSRDLTHCQSIRCDRLPEGLVEIADAVGGNAIILSLRPESFGNVFFFDHELEAEDDLWSALTFSSATFTEFLNALRPLDPKAVELKPDDVLSVWIDPEFAKSLGKRKP